MASRRAATLESIKICWALRGQGPSIREVAAAIGADYGTARDLLRKLEDEGLIIWRRGRAGQKGEILLPDPKDRQSLGDTLSALRRLENVVGKETIGAILRDTYSLSQNPLPMIAMLSHLDHVDVAVGTGTDDDDADCAAGDSRGTGA